MGDVTTCKLQLRFNSTCLRVRDAELVRWKASAYPIASLLKPLDRPLRPIFVCPANWRDDRPPLLGDDKDFYPVVCLSASRLPEDNLTDNDRYYVQGSGDDHEAWSMVCFSLLLR